MEFVSKQGIVAKSFLVAIVFMLLTPLYSLGDIENEGQSAVNGMPIPKKRVKTIIVDDYHPYTFVNKNGVPDGFSVDLMKDVTRVMGLELEIRVDTWERAVRALKAGEIDFLPMMAYSGERDRLFDFSAPHTIAYDAFFTRKGSGEIKSLDDLQGKTIIVMEGDQAHDYLLSAGLTEPAKLVLIHGLSDALRLLASGRGDAALMPKLVGLVVVKNLDLTNIDPSPVVIEAYNRPFSFAVREGNQPLLERLTQGLSIVKTSDQYSAIYTKWFGTLEPKSLTLRATLKYVIGVIVALTLIGSILLLWSFSLRKQVALRTKTLEGEITERKRIEHELRKSRENYRTVVEDMPAMICRFLPDGQLTFANGEYCKFVGKNIGELLGQTFFQFIPDEEQGEVRNHFVSLTQKEPIITYDHQVVRPDGAVRWQEWTGRALFDKEGHLLEYQSIGRDVTEQKKAQSEKDKLQKQLLQAQKMETLGTLVAGVAHEINNPNNFITINAPMLLKSWESIIPILEEYYGKNGDFPVGGLPFTTMRERVPQLLSGISDGSERIKKIVSDLKRFAQPGVSGALEPIDINSVVKSALTLIANMAKKATNNFNVEYGKNLPQFMGNCQQLEQVVINLVQNACQALPDNSKGIHISTYYDKKEQAVRVKVRDEGIGIPPGSLPRVMDPFFTTKRHAGGTGLGLSVSSMIIKEHGGEIDVDSEEGKGTTFTVSLPIKEKIQALKVLIVDDNDALRKMLGRFFEKSFDFLVKESSSGVDACIKLGTYRPELLVLDIQMPDMNGVEICEKIKSEPVFSGMKTIIITGFPKSDEANEIAKMGFTNVYSKPFDLTGFRAMVEKTMNV